jgi:hypothetical protein
VIAVPMDARRRDHQGAGESKARPLPLSCPPETRPVPA